MVQHHPQGLGDYLAAIPEPTAALLVVCAIVVFYFLARPGIVSLGRIGAVLFLFFGLIFVSTGVAAIFFYCFPDRIPYPSRGTPDLETSLPQCVGMAAGGLAALKLSWDAYRAREPIRWERLLFWKNSGGGF